MLSTIQKSACPPFRKAPPYLVDMTMKNNQIIEFQFVFIQVNYLLNEI